jgi:F-box protein, helicase, 18
MNYSEEQEKVLSSKGNLLINAVAGSGKTSTLIGYAERNPKKKILYLAFNKSVKLEAEHKFSEKALKNVKVTTAHSLALRHFANNQLKIRQGSSYSAFDAKNILGFKRKDIIADMKYGKHVIDMVNCFCNSSASKVIEMDYLSFLKEGKDKEFVKVNYGELLLSSRQFLGKMMNNEIEISHDFYLKQFQLSSPKYPFDTLFFDEGQDASAVMLDVFLNQKGDRIIVGDEHQQIYRWRYAVNALREVDFAKTHLNTSFRFPQSIADLAKNILETKSLLSNTIGEISMPDIKGRGDSAEIATNAIVGRTNSALLVEAINLLIENKAVSKVYFEGNFSSYTYADEGGSIYDVLNLYLDKRKKIRDPLIKSFKSLFELEQYADETEDSPMKGLIHIVNTYKKELPSLIKKIKEHHVADDSKEEAEVVFSTVHKAKGMEYDEVTLLNDFLGEERLKTLLNGEEVDLNKLEEDINILYVAATRTKTKLNIPEGILPLSFTKRDDKNINVLVDKQEVVELDYANISRASNENRTFSLENRRLENNQAYEKWTDEKDAELTLMIKNGRSTQELSEHFYRSKGAIRSRIKKLEL